MKPQTLDLHRPFEARRLFSRLLRLLSLLPAFFALCGTASAEQEPLRSYDYKMAGDAQHTRIVMHFDEAPDPDWFLLRDPHRLVIDLAETEFVFDQKDLAPRGLVSGVRYGNIGQGRSRMILSAVGPFAVDEIDVRANETSPGFRMIVDISASSATAFEDALRERVARPLNTADPARKGTRVDADKEIGFTVAVDAGHGGIDTGARGVNGTAEKTITLAFARELKEALKKSGKYNVVLTRDKDVFLRLDERVRIAREHDADLLISIHADAIRLRGLRGATIYTVSDRASDAEAAATAARENLADELAGIVVAEENDEVADILGDLIRRETHSFSIRFARSLLGELSDAVEFVNNPHRSAGFKVLRAPDVPSVLLELGYLSNPKDEVQMSDPEWRAKAVERIVAAIGLFADAKAGAGG